MQCRKIGGTALPEKEGDGSALFICPECGAFVSESAQVCHKCGARLIEEEGKVEEEKVQARQPEPATLYLCPSCGAFSTEDAARCPRCGEFLPRDIEEAPSAPEVQETEEKKVITFCTVCGAFVPEGVERCPRCNALVSLPDEVKPAALSEEDAALLEMILTAAEEKPEVVKVLRGIPAPRPKEEEEIMSLLVPKKEEGLPPEAQERTEDASLISQGADKEQGKVEPSPAEDLLLDLLGPKEDGKEERVEAEPSAGEDLDSLMSMLVTTEDAKAERMPRRHRRRPVRQRGAAKIEGVFGDKGAMLVCGECGAFMLEGAKHCEICGASIEPSAVVRAPEADAPAPDPARRAEEVLMRILGVSGEVREEEVREPAERAIEICTVCGALMGAGAESCTMCGTLAKDMPLLDLAAYPEPPRAVERGLIVCTSCGGFVREGERFCQRCGRELAPVVKADIPYQWAEQERAAELTLRKLLGVEEIGLPPEEGKEEGLSVCSACGAFMSGTGPCPKCGAGEEDGEVADLIRMLEPSAEEEVVACPLCGANIPSETGECTSCGIALGDHPEARSMAVRELEDLEKDMEEMILREGAPEDILLDLDDAEEGKVPGAGEGEILELVKEIDGTVAELEERAKPTEGIEVPQTEEDITALLDEVIDISGQPSVTEVAVPPEAAEETIESAAPEVIEAPEIEAEPVARALPELPAPLIEERAPEHEVMAGDRLSPGPLPMKREGVREDIPMVREPWRGPAEILVFLSTGVLIFYLVMGLVWPARREFLLVMFEIGVPLIAALRTLRPRHLLGFKARAWAGLFLVAAGGAVVGLVPMRWATPWAPSTEGAALLVVGLIIVTMGVVWASEIRWQSLYLGAVMAVLCTSALLILTGSGLAIPHYLSFGAAVVLFLSSSFFLRSALRFVIETERQVMIGDARYMRKDYKEAAKAYSSAIGAVSRGRGLPRSFDVPWYSKGAALVLMGECEEGLKCLDMALEINPENEITWVNKGNALFRMGKHEEAMECFQRAIDLNPNYEVAWNNLGNMHARQGKLIEALRAYNRAIKINANYRDVWVNKGYVLVKMGKYDEAKRCVATAQGEA
ncbi:MAG: tetratricopeptide repeat protein [Candidatus Thermoplasmatota archaeon]